MSDLGGGEAPTVALQRVLATISYLLTRSQVHERKAARAGVTTGRSDLWLLMALDGTGGVSRVGDLAALLLVEPPHVTRQIGHLVAQGLVERTADTADRRGRRIAITAHGKAVLERFQQAGLASLQDALEGIRDTDVAVTVAVLERLVEHAREQDAEAVPGTRPRS